MILSDLAAFSAYDPRVFQAQSVLAELGFNKPGNVDGLWGGATTEAVVNFRLWVGLPAVGDDQSDLMDAAFWDALTREAGIAGVTIPTPPTGTPSYSVPKGVRTSAASGAPVSIPSALGGGSSSGWMLALAIAGLGAFLLLGLRR